MTIIAVITVVLLALTFSAAMAKDRASLIDICIDVSPSCVKSIARFAAVGIGAASAIVTYSVLAAVVFFQIARFF